MMKPEKRNLIVFAMLVGVYILAQFFIGTYDAKFSRFVFDKPADVDFLYYASIINTITNHFPPQNPAFAGVKLTQSFLQYYPAAFLAKIVNPYDAIRILNVLYLILLGFIFRKYFRKTYGLALILIFAASIFASGINALGVDLIARGFTHTPFFILFTLALFAKNIRIKALSIFVAAFVNGYLMLMIVPYYLIVAIIEKRRNDIIILVSSGVATILAALLVSSEAVIKSFYFIFTESFAFRPVETILHALPVIILSFIFVHKRMRILIAVSVIFGSLIHYNPFFPIFMLYFAGAVTVAEGRMKEHIPYIRTLNYCIILILIAGFLYSGFEKYYPGHKNYYPRFDSRQDAAINWVVHNTTKGDVFLALTADADHLAFIMEYRSVYMGFIGHLAHLGLDWQSRYNSTRRTWSGGPIPPEVNFVYYGPLEKEYFPGFKTGLPEVYKDSFVTIYKAR